MNKKNPKTAEELTKDIIYHQGVLWGIAWACEQIMKQTGDLSILSSDLYRKAVMELGEGDPLGTEELNKDWKPFEDNTYPLEYPSEFRH